VPLDTYPHGLLGKHGFDAQPNSADQSGDDDGDYCLESVTLHATEDDEAISRSLDLVAEDLEALTETKRGKLIFDQTLGGLRQRPLRLADTDRKRAALSLAGLDKKFAEEMRLTRAAATIQALVTRWCQQRFEHLRCWNSKNGQ
jgi:hypothetical protein